MQGDCHERKVLRFVFRGLIGIVGLVAVLGALFAYFAYSTTPEVPRLSGTLTLGAITVGDCSGRTGPTCLGDWQKERRSWW